MPNVSVNLAVEIDASGTVEVFGQASPSVNNKIVASVTLPVRALYDASGNSNYGTLNSFFEFWEPSSALGERRATLSGKDTSNASEGRDYRKMEKKLAMDFQSVIMGQFDCSGAKPFDGYKSNTNYTTVPHFGRLALSVYAHYLFGHIAATAAITNDSQFMENIMSTDNVTASSAGTYRKATTADVVISDAASVSDANLAARLVYKIISKNDDAILSIVEQVLGQDASRAMDQDNNFISPDIRQGLRFEAGDKIYLNIRLKRPQVAIYSGINAGAPAATAVPDIADPVLDPRAKDMNYTLEITLENKEGALFELGHESVLNTKLGNEAIYNIYNAINSTSVNSGDYVPVSSLYNLSTVPSGDLSAVRSALVGIFFEQTGLDYFTTSKLELGITNATVTDNITVINTKKATGAIDVTSVSVTNSIYMNSNEVGEVLYLTNGSETFTIIKTSDTTYSYNGTTYNAGDNIMFGNRKIILGSYLVVLSAYPPVISYSKSNYDLTRTVAMTSITPINNGDPASSFSIVSGTLPDGLSFSTATGTISGTPTTEATAVNITVRATNISGSGDVTISLAVLAVSPDISYFSPSYTFPRNTPIADITPTLFGGDSVTSYSIQSGTLPAGLSFNTSTGVISGTPTAVTAKGTIVVRGSNSGGYDEFSLEIEIKEAVPDISYSSSTYTYPKGVTIANVTPSLISGDAPELYEITAGTLPAGLSLNSSTGVISGTPSAEQATSSVVIRASTTGGSDSFTISFTVNLVAPNIYYATAPFVFTRGIAITPMSPTNTNSDPVALYQVVSGTLPAGLSLNSSTGVISGTPTTEQAAANVTIRASNSGGFDDEVVSFAVNLVAPSIQYDASGYIFTRTTAISAITVNATGDAATYDVSGTALPAGLTLNSSTGQITGTPTVTSTATNYVIRARNSGGMSTFTISITVNPLPPNISYNPSTYSFGVSAAITTITVNNSGDAATYDVSGTALPAGLSLNSSTGAITGTPTTVTSAANYVIRATNISGVSTFTLSITITPAPGIPVWGRWLDGAGSDTTTSITYDNSGNIYVVGYTDNNLQSTLMTIFDVSKPGSGLSGFVIKYDSSGVALWGRWLDGGSNDVVNSITIDSNGNLYVTGYASGNDLQLALMTVFDTGRPGTTTAAFVVKYNSNGIPQWGRWMDGTSVDQGISITTDGYGNVYVTGTAASANLQSSLMAIFDTSKPGSGQGIFVIKYDSSGVALWGRWLDGTGTDNVRSITTDSNGNVYVTGYVNSELQSSIITVFDISKPSGANNGVFVIKYDSSGVAQWGRWLDSGASEVPYSITTDSNGNVYVIGNSSQDFQPSIMTVFNTSKPGSLMAGFIVKYNSNGIPQWGRWLDGINNDYGRGITTDNNDNIYVTGYGDDNLQSTLMTVFNMSKPSGTGSGGFIIKYNSSGIPQWGRWIQNISVMYGITHNKNNNIYITGTTTTDLESSVGTVFDTSKPGAATTGSFIIKYTA